MPAGGYQAPQNPAPVSGPGALSARTDGGPAQAMRDLPNAKYGENSDYRAIQAGAPMAAAPSAPSGGAPAASAGAPPTSDPMDAPLPLTAPSSRPGEPVTHGADLGAGGSSRILGLPDPTGASYNNVATRLQQLADATGNADIRLLAGLAGTGRF